MNLRLLEQVERRAREAPDAPTVRQVGESSYVSRGELQKWTSALSARLAEAVSPGGVVLICCPNQPQFIVAFLAAIHAGLRAFPVSPELADPELFSAAERASAKAVIGTTHVTRLFRDRVGLSISVDDVAHLPAA